LWKHGRKHFGRQAPAREVYRRILERRAAESDADYENGVATLVSTIGYLEVMMHRGFETLTDENTTMSPQVLLTRSFQTLVVCFETEAFSGQGLAWRGWRSGAANRRSVLQRRRPPYRRRSGSRGRSSGLPRGWSRAWVCASGLLRG
jgi:hypothetical protein